MWLRKSTISHRLEMNRASAISDNRLPFAPLRIVSWNLLRRVGARAEDVANLIRIQHPELLLLQEATEDMTVLPSLVGGHFFHYPMQGRIHGLAAWTPNNIPAPAILRLPVSALPGRVPPRVAQLVHLHGISFANVHLSHGQFLNRWQLRKLSGALEGPAAIIGDFNSVGAIILPGFKDVGPRQRTHRMSNIIALRLDRCMARNVRCISAAVLEKGASDHRPIVLDLVAMTKTDRHDENPRLHPGDNRAAGLLTQR